MASERFSKALNEWIEGGKLTSKLYPEIWKGVEQIIKKLRAFDYLKRDKEDVADLVTEVIVEFNKQLGLGKVFENPEGYLFIIARNKLNNADVDIANKDYVILSKKLKEALNDLENDGRILSSNNSYRSKDAVNTLHVDRDTVFSAFSYFNSNEVRTGSSDIWTRDRLEALKRNVMHVIDDLDGTVTFNDLMELTAAKLGMGRGYIVSLSENDEDDNVAPIEIADAGNADLSEDDLKSIDLLVQSLLSEIAHHLQPLKNDPKKEKLVWVVIRHHKEFLGEKPMREIAKLSGYDRAQNIDYYAGKYMFLKDVIKRFYNRAFELSLESDKPKEYLFSFNDRLLEIIDMHLGISSGNGGNDE